LVYSSVRAGCGTVPEMPARILLVDDHESVRRGVRGLFTNNNSFEVCGEAQNGTDAIRMVSDLSPDVVILDLTMPGLTGFQTAAKIREIAPSIRIIFFTIHDIPSSAWWIGADACVSKSATLEELTLTVNRVLQLRGNFQP
jgi:DNA-binding NarL/FixJ family response regulator